MSEKDLITKYVPSYVSSNNPSSWSSVSNFSVNEILAGGEAVYGLMHDTRLEISILVKFLGNIDQSADVAQNTKRYGNNKFTNYEDYISKNPKLTIHEYYEDVRKRATDATKNQLN